MRDDLWPANTLVDQPNRRFGVADSGADLATKRIDETPLRSNMPGNNFRLVSQVLF